MIALQINPSAMAWQPLLITIVPILLSGLLSFVAAIWVNRRETKKLGLQHQHQLEVLQHEKQEQLHLEIDKMQAEAFCLLYSPLKHLSKNPDNPYAMFSVQKSGSTKTTFLNLSLGKTFLDSLNCYLYSARGELFLPRIFRNQLYHLRGLIHGIVANSSGQVFVAITNPKTLASINSLISGDESIHKQLRCLMGTEDRKPLSKDE